MTPSIHLALFLTPIPFCSAFACPVDTRTPGTLHLSDAMLEKVAAGLAARTGDTDVESDESDPGEASRE